MLRVKSKTEDGYIRISDLCKDSGDELFIKAFSETMFDVSNRASGKVKKLFEGNEELGVRVSINRSNHIAFQIVKLTRKS